MTTRTRTGIIVFILVFLLELAGTWSIPLIDRDEPRFAEASREMRERGDYLVPYFNAKYRFDKPALIYWCQSASYTLFGENEFAARLPSVLAAAGTAVLIFLFGCRIRGEKIGLIGAAAFSVCPVTIYIGKAATADMVMVFFVALASLAGWEILNKPKRLVGWWLTFYIALGLGFLTKGPVAWLPLGTALITCAVARDGAAFKRLGIFWGILLMLVVAGSWGIPAQIATDGEFYRVGIGRHVVQRAVQPMEGHGATGPIAYLLWFPFHFLCVFIFFLPWSLKLPAALRWYCHEGRRDSTNLYLGIGVLITFVLFSLYSTKLPHYTLPAYPMLALLFARYCDAAGIEWRHVRKQALAFGGAVALICLAVPPFITQCFPSKALFLAARPHLKPEMKWASVEYTEGSLIWYFRSTIHGFHDSISEKKAGKFMREKGPRLLIIPTAKLNAVNLDPSWQNIRVHGFNLPKGKRVDLTLLLKEQ